MSHKKFLFLLVAVVAVVAVTAVAGRRAQERQEKESPALEKAKEDFYTVTDADKPEPSDPEKRRLRRARGNRYTMPDKNEDARRYAITEQTQTGFGALEIHAPAEPALPAARSDAVVIGEVTDAEAFLSTDRTGIYSEFTVGVGEVLKDASGTLTPGGSITAERGGGAVRFPSGKVVRRGIHGKPLPRVGRRYVFFLKRAAEADYFSVITAYELRGGRVFPLDGLYMTGEVVHQLAAHQKFTGADEATFLAAVREAIAQNSGGTDERRRAQ